MIVTGLSPSLLQMLPVLAGGLGVLVIVLGAAQAPKVPGGQRPIAPAVRSTSIALFVLAAALFACIRFGVLR